MIPTMDIEVIGSKATAKIRALIDTGFSGFLCLPIKIGKTLGLELIGTEVTEVADGRWIDQLKFAGSVKFLGKTQEVEIFLSESDTSQIGTMLLADCQLSIDFTADKVKVTRKRI